MTPTLNSKVFLPFTSDPTARFKLELTSVVSSWKNPLELSKRPSKKTHRFLGPKTPLTGGRLLAPERAALPDLADHHILIDGLGLDRTWAVLLEVLELEMKRLELVASF